MFLQHLPESLQSQTSESYEVKLYFSSYCIATQGSR